MHQKTKLSTVPVQNLVINVVGSSQNSLCRLIVLVPITESSIEKKKRQEIQKKWLVIRTGLGKALVTRSQTGL